MSPDTVVVLGMVLLVAVASVTGWVALIAKRQADARAREQAVLLAARRAARGGAVRLGDTPRPPAAPPRPRDDPARPPRHHR